MTFIDAAMLFGLLPALAFGTVAALRWHDRYAEKARR